MNDYIWKERMDNNDFSYLLSSTRISEREEKGRESKKGSAFSSDSLL